MHTSARAVVLCSHSHQKRIYLYICEKTRFCPQGLKALMRAVCANARRVGGGEEGLSQDRR